MSLMSPAFLARKVFDNRRIIPCLSGYPRPFLFSIKLSEKRHSQLGGYHDLPTKKLPSILATMDLKASDEILQFCLSADFIENRGRGRYCVTRPMLFFNVLCIMGIHDACSKAFKALWASISIF